MIVTAATGSEPELNERMRQTRFDKKGVIQGFGHPGALPAQAHANQIEELVLGHLNPLTTA
jgi:hypothetical protein